MMVSVMAAALILGGCSSGGGKTADSGDGDSKQSFTWVVNSELASMDTSLATDMISFGMLNNVYEGIYRIDKDNQPILAGAEKEAEVSEDGLTYTVKLREDAKWTNGDPVTAKDYVYGWQRTVDPTTASEYGYMFDPVLNATEIQNGDKDKKELGIKATGDYELEITLAKPTPYFPYLLAFPTYFPQHETTVEKYGKDYATDDSKAVYNGPFVLTDFKGPGTDTSWKLKANDKYWDKKAVKMAEIDFDVVKEENTAINLFQDGQADDVTLTGDAALQLKDDKSFVIAPGATIQYLGLNQRKEDSPFKNVNLRKAIAYSIDREAIVNKILGNGSLSANGIVPDGFAKNPDTNEDFAKQAATKLEFDTTKAGEAWDKAKQELGITELKFELLGSDVTYSKKVSEYVKGAIEEALPGVKITIASVPLSVRLDRAQSGDYDVIMNNWIADYTDPSTFTDLFTTKSPQNISGWSNGDYDKWVEKSNGEDANDPTKRFDDMVEAAKVINEDMGIVPIFQNAEAHLRNQKLKGLVTHAAGAAWDFKWTEME